MGKWKKLGTSNIDTKNRTYIPQQVRDFLPKGDKLSWELDEETGRIFVFIGQTRFFRDPKAYQKKTGVEQ